MRIAAFTMVRDESVFLPIWIRYYAGQFGMENLTVIDHGSIDGCCAGLACNVLRLPRTELDEKKRALLVSHLNSALLRAYDAVVYCDADEILVPDPDRYADLRAYVARNDRPITAAVGLALLHVRDEEAPIRLSDPILTQRRFAQFHGLYCKPLLSRTDVVWKVGFHGCKGDVAETVEIDRDLYLFHLKSMDYQIAHRYLEMRRSNRMSDNSIREKHSQQFRLDDEAFDRLYFRVGASDVRQAAPGFDFREDIALKLSGRQTDFEGFGSIRIIPERYRTKF